MESNTTVASVVVAVALVLVTAWYAYQTWRMVNEMKEGRVKAVMPIVTCDVELDFEKTQGFVGKFSNILVRNIGNSLALETTVELQLKNPDTSILQIESQQWFLGVMGPDNQRTIEMNPCNLRTTEMNPCNLKILGFSALPRIEITLTCTNVYGLVSKTVSTFELQITEPPQAIDLKQQYRWVKLKETVDPLRQLTRARGCHDFVTRLSLQLRTRRKG